VGDYEREGDVFPAGATIIPRMTVDFFSLYLLATPYIGMKAAGSYVRVYVVYIPPRSVRFHDAVFKHTGCFTFLFLNASVLLCVHLLWRYMC
jgi:hypothetical protein